MPSWQNSPGAACWRCWQIRPTSKPQAGRLPSASSMVHWRRSSTRRAGRIIVASFASHISRIQQVANAAANHKRKIAFIGTSMVENVKMARQLDYLELEESMVVPADNALHMPDNEVVLMVTGSQGEPTSIMGRLCSRYQSHLRYQGRVIRSSYLQPPSRAMKNRSTTSSTACTSGAPM